VIVAGIEAKDLQALLAAMRAYFEAGRARQDAIGDEIRKASAALDLIDAEPRTAGPAGRPLTRHLPAALALTRAEAPELACLLEPIAELLPWRYGYVARPDAPGLDASMGWAELVGPEAPFRSGQVCLGLTLIGPGNHYLPHRHPAVELYRVLAGRAEWSAGEVAAVESPGAYILHAANIVHAMRTEEEPLLAIYSWTGDVVSPSVWADGGHPSEGTQP
jgi:hypothetical protein